MNIYSRNIIYFLSSFLLFSTIKAVAQPTVEWDKTYGGSHYETLNDALKTEDDGFLLIGHSSSPQGGDVSEPSRGNGLGDFWLVRIDAQGNKKWDKRYGGDQNDICHAGVQNTQGYLLVGESNSGISGEKTTANKGWKDFWVMQIRPDGSKVWDKTFGGKEADIAFNVVKLPNEAGYVILGHSNSNADGDKSENSKGGLDLWVIRIDPNGNKVWDKTFGGSGSDEYPIGMTLTKDGNIILACGSSSGKSGDRSSILQGVKDYWILKITPDGQKIWDKSFGGDADDSPRSLTELTDGSVVVCGYSHSEPFGEKTAPLYGEADYWLVRIDKDGNKIWDKSYGGSNYDYAITIDQNKTGYFLVAGQTISQPSGNKEDSLKGLFDFWILYLNENGDKIWEKTVGGALNDNPFKMVKFKDGSYLVCGLSKSNKSDDKTEDNRDQINPPPSDITDDMWIVKINCVSELHIGNDTLVCQYKPLVLDATIPDCRNCLYRWSTGETTAKIVVKPTKTSQYTVSVTANNACELQDDVEIDVIQPPNAFSFVLTPPRCNNGTDGVIAIDSISGGTPPYSIVVKGDTLINQIFVPNLKAGDYPVVLIDKKGCKLDTLVKLENPTPFNIYITQSQELSFGDSFRLWAIGNHTLDTFFWTDRSIRVLDTIVKPFDSQTFGITAIDEYGCQKTAVTQITVRRDNLYFTPQAFSPNNDRVNDFYQIYGGKTVVSIDDMKIFDRWGEMMYETTRIYPAPEQMGWDGRINGHEALPGVYVFFATVTYIDGRKGLIKGDFTLAR